MLSAQALLQTVLQLVCNSKSQITTIKQRLTIQLNSPPVLLRFYLTSLTRPILLAQTNLTRLTRLVPVLILQVLVPDPTIPTRPARTIPTTQGNPTSLTSRASPAV